MPPKNKEYQNQKLIGQLEMINLSYGEETHPVSYRRKNPSPRMSRKKRRRFFYRKLQRIFLSVLCFIVFSFLLFCYLFLPDFKSSGDTAAQKVQAVNSNHFSTSLFQNSRQGIRTDLYNKHPLWEEKFLTVSEYARPGTPVGKVKNIFIHYTANPGTSAAQNHSYFEQLKDTRERSASAHFIIGYQGEIIQCIPLDEMAYAVQTRNEDSISVECCHLAQDGSFTPETYDSLITLLRWLMDVYQLEEEDILRHYDCGGKKCPLYYTEHEDAWEELKREVKKIS